MIEHGPEALAGKRIESRADAAQVALPGSVRDWVLQDVEDFKLITDPDLLRFAAVAITDNFDSPGYKAEFDVLGAELAEQVKSLHEQDSAISWERDESDTLGYAFDLLEQEHKAKQWSEPEAIAQAEMDMARFLNPSHKNPLTREYELDMQVADMARNAMASEPYRQALQAAQPEIAAKVASHPVRPAGELMNATFVGKIVAISGAHLEMKTGRNPADTMAHPRLGLSGDPVEVGQVATIKYAQGRGQVNNHELSRDQKGVGR